MMAGNGHIDIHDLKRAADGRWPEIHANVGGISAALLDGKHHPCPKCDGTDRFRVFNNFEQTGGMICNQCFAERNGDGIAALQWLTGENFPATVKRIAGFLGIVPSNNGNSQSDIVADIAHRKRIPIDSFRGFGAHKAQRGKLTVCRVPMYGPDGKECSYFDLALTDKKWEKGRCAKGKLAGIFLREGRLPESGQRVVLAEGVKDAAALDSLGFTAVGLPTKELKAEFARLFRGCQNIIVPDRDEGGEAGAQKTAARLAGVRASVRVATLPGELKSRDGDGVREILAKRDGERLLRQAIDDAQEWEPPKPKLGMPSITDAAGRTDIANAQRFVALHGQDVRFCYPWKKWMVWDGRRWKVDDNGTVMRFAISVADAVWKEALESGNDAALKFAAESAKARSVRAILSLAACEVPVLPGELDSGPFLLNVENGTFDLHTGQLKDHCRSDLITKLCPVEYDPDAHSELWNAFIDRIFNRSVDLIQFVQRWLGYRLTGDIREQLLLIFWGVGNNGKSTLLDVVVWLMGEYADDAAQHLLTERRGGDEHPTEIADLCGKRLIVASESEKDRKLRIQLMKMLTGNARLKGRFNRQDYFSFDRTFEPILVTNNKPRINENTEAVKRRVRLVPFTTIIPKEERDKTLVDKLKAEASGILNWLLQGCLDWQQHGLDEPSAVTEATAEYRQEFDPLHDFIIECCVTGPDYWAKSSDLRKLYEAFCAERGDRPVEGGDFTDSLKQHNCKPIRRHLGRGWVGIGIVADTTTQNGPSASEQF